MNRSFFESKIKGTLMYVGLIVSSIMAVAYILCVFVLIEGFKIDKIINTTIFSIITAAIGFCIMQMLKIQGKSFAENLPENKEILNKYYCTKTKDKVNHSMKYFWITSCIGDVLGKCLTLAVTSIGAIYIMIEGSGDYNLLILAGVNLLMFAGFGLLSLVKTYDFFNNSYIPYILEKIKEVENVKETKTNTSEIKKEIPEAISTEKVL